MNKTKARWQLYRMLRKKHLIVPMRGGYSYANFEDFCYHTFKIKLAVFGDPIRYVKELLEKW